MINLNKKMAVLGLSVMLAGPVLASDDKQVSDEIRQSAVAPATTVTPVEDVNPVDAPKPKYWIGRGFAKVFGDGAAISIGRKLGIDYSKSYVEVNNSQKAVVSAFSELSAEEQAQILLAIKARDLQSVIKMGEQAPMLKRNSDEDKAVEGVAPVAPTPPPAPPAPGVVAAKAPVGELLNSIQQGKLLKKTEIAERPKFDAPNTNPSWADAVVSRRGALEQSDNEDSDWE